MSDLIKVGTTSDKALMMAVLQGGGEVHGEGWVWRWNDEHLMRECDCSGEVTQTGYLPTEATLYVSPETKFHAGDVLKLWEVNEGLEFRSGRRVYTGLSYKGEDFLLCDSFTLTSPERDVFAEPRKDDVVEQTDGASKVRVVAVDSDVVFYITEVGGGNVSSNRWRKFAATHTVVHRAEEGGGDE